MTAHRIPSGMGQRYASVFFLSGLTMVLSDLVYMAGPSFYPLYSFFPVEIAVNQAISSENLWRLAGIGFGAQYFCWFLIARFGIRGILDWTRPWRFLGLAGAFSLALLEGFARPSFFLPCCWSCSFISKACFELDWRSCYRLALP